ncbi:MAG TPA: tetratricopeptide repeat protein [Burkholderiales bacterium]|nr:tetratricopeptide repeat protein [Burkholderiales bacterium]
MVRSKRFELQGRSRERKFPLLLVVITITTITKSPSGLAADEEGGCTPVIGRVVSVQGTVEAQRAGALSWTRISRLDTPVCEGDRLRAARASRAAVFLQPENLIRLDQNSEILFSHTAEETLLEFFQEHTAVAPDALTQGCGAGYVITRFPKKFRIRTPHVNAAVEGTEFLVALRCEVTELAVFEGKVRAQATAQLEEQVLASGQVLSASAAEPPAIRLLVRPADAVQWALYYPPLSDAGIAVPSAEECAQLPAGAIRQVCFAQRAEHLLRLGRVEEAESEISMALAETPASGDALAIRAVISVVKGDKDGALSAAQNAVQISPASSRAWLALSYAQQAQFKLEDATKSVRRAAELSPDSSLTQARLAEMFMSLGRTGDAEKAARRAVEANSNEERAHTVLGFVHLAQINVKEAQADFLKAIERDSTAPLPRLGLGLAIIRQGQLVPGREQLEIAVALDPTNSLLRSYVGKAYYEENTRERDQLAATQFDLAKQLDPNDPTPWFYQAILALVANQPTQALSNLQQSIRLNDHRAIYRSTLLLEEDIATRSLSLARLYRALGFDQLAIAEAARSLTAEPGNFSAHRFLSDTYATLPRHDIARVSELLQAQVRQLLSAEPIQPQLSEDRLFISRGAISQEPGTFEFTDLFIQHGMAARIRVLDGTQDTYADEAGISALLDHASLSIGRFYYETEGFRPNNDYQRRISNAFLQISPSQSLNLQVELRNSDFERGDLVLRFDPSNFRPERAKVKNSIDRLSARYGFGVGNDVVLSFIHNDSLVDFEFPGLITILEHTDNSLAEAQSIVRFGPIGATLGGGYVRGHNNVNFGGFLTADTLQTQSNGYAYFNVHVSPGFLLTAGLSADQFEDPLVERSKTSPKLGAIFSPLNSLTIRAAVFETMNRILPTNQTLEPTQIAGFNQFFDEPNGSTSTRKGIGTDYKLSNAIYLGGEVAERDIQWVLIDPIANLAEDGDWTEKTGRVYAYATIGPHVALSAEVYREHYKRAPGFQGAEEFLELRSTRIPIGMNIFVGGRVVIRGYVSHYKQEGIFIDSFGSPFQGDERFTTVDAQVSYYLPRRSGVITIDGRNLGDRNARYQESNLAAPRFVPQRQLFLSLVLRL